MHGMSHTSLTTEIKECVQECHGCHDICLESVTHCLEMSGEHARLEHIRLLLDCAEICQTSANFMLRVSERHPSFCEVCAELCERCAEDCERFNDDEMMQMCAQVCRSCAKSCRAMARGS